MSLRRLAIGRLLLHGNRLPRTTEPYHEIFLAGTLELHEWLRLYDLAAENETG